MKRQFKRSIRNSITIASTIFILSFINSIGIASAQSPTLQMISATLSNQQLNAISQIRINGKLNNAELKKGDCLKVYKNQPYIESKNLYEQASGQKDFYVPFPQSQQYSLGSTSSPSATIKRDDDTSLTITVTEDSKDGSFIYEISSILNPFSRVQDSNLQLKHFASCGTKETPCASSKACIAALVTLYTIPNKGTLAVASSSISPPTGKTENSVASTDGFFNIKFKPGSEFPRYGGSLAIGIPEWYPGAEEQSVFSLQPKTICSAPADVIKIETQQTANLVHTILFSKYTPGKEIELKCSNYRNPLKAGVIRGFKITLSDRETPQNLIAEYPSWSFKIDKLSPRKLKEDLKFELFADQSQVPSKDPLPVQTKAGLSIEFNMGSIPVGYTQQGCFVKYIFPSDIPLPSARLEGGYLSSSEPNEQMLNSEGGGANLAIEGEVFIRNQGYSAGNSVIIRGCHYKGTVGLNKKAKIKFGGIYLPDAVKTTKPFTVEVYQSFDLLEWILSDLVVSGSGVITADNFHGGTLSEGLFKGINNQIQYKGATHQLAFKLMSSLPAKDSRQDTRVVVMMPEKLTGDPQATLLVQNLDGHFINAKIARETKHKGCQGTAVCYSLTHSNVIKIKGGTTLIFSITGTTNQESQQKAGKWKVWTQLQDISQGSNEEYYSIDSGEFDTDWTAQAGSIVVDGRATEANNYTNFASPVKYTIYSNLENYIPAGGILEVTIPDQITFISSPFDEFSSNSPNLEKTTEYTKQSFKLIAKGKVDKGSLTINFGGVRNPVSFLPTDVFKMKSNDALGYDVGSGNLDNIIMSQPSLFEDMDVQANNQTNGAVTDYTFRFSALVPLNNGDRFRINFPSNIKTPRQVKCEAIKCLDEFKCTSDRGRIVFTFIKLAEGCNKIKSDVSFKIFAIKNPPSLVESGKITASFTNQEYREVAAYSGNLRIQNKFMADLNPDKTSLHQLNLDFGVTTTYQLIFRPTNPIPRSGWILVVYPENISIEDEVEFLKQCYIFTSRSYKGPNYCNLVTSKRQIWLYNIFEDTTSDGYAATVQIELQFQNPSTNFFGSIKESDLAFHITTYAFDPLQTAEMENSGYSAQSVTNFVTKIKPDPLQFAKGIDILKKNHLVPQLKCREPCLKCLDNDPNYCTACWGPGKDNSNKLTFLQSKFGEQTCKAQCDVKSSVNGQIIETKDSAGKVDSTKSYFVCQDCDTVCHTCKGQTSLGKRGDSAICVTCDPSFKYFLPEQKTCSPSCNGNFYAKVDKPWGPTLADQSSCGKCQEPCTACRACNPLVDPNCDAKDPDNGAKFCTACDQSIFFPIIIDDLDNPEQYFLNQAGMATSKTALLTQAQITYINKNFGENKRKMTPFLDKKVLALPDGTESKKPLTSETGLDTSMQGIQINADTTYGMLYKAMYGKYQFPKQSLLEGRCYDFCPVGYASVRGLCSPCQSPCASCRTDTTRCLSCKQTSDNDKKYLFGRKCYEECPQSTVPDEKTKECKACVTGCDICKLEDLNACLSCSRPLLLLKEKCYAQCPDGYRSNFWRTRCNLDEPLRVIYLPQTILTALILVICVAGKWSSKNVFGQHRIFLSFYALTGLVDALTMWSQLIFTLIEGEIWQVFVPIIALIANYYLNFQYVKLWNVLDPPKPGDEDDLTLKEVELINECDSYFDQWNTKYHRMAIYIKRLVTFISHKSFQLPFTHFYGYLHLTLRSQDNFQRWEWDLAQWSRWKNGALANGTVASDLFLFHGKLVDRKGGPDGKTKNEVIHGDDDHDQYEGGRRHRPPLAKGDFNPLDYVQSPLATGEPTPDLRIYNMFKRQIKVDFIFIRGIMIVGNIFLLAFDYGRREHMSQIAMCSIESLLMAFLMMGMQWQVYKRWDEHKLPFKMKDAKSNYLFKPIRYPGELKRLEQYLTGEDDRINVDWERYLPYYKMNEIYLDNKLEELLDIFGRRQCKSCVEFGTGTELEADPRRHRSFPLSPRGEELYRGMEAEFNLIDFQLMNNVYADVEVPSVMFSNVAKDFSDFGAQAFDNNILKALSRKGGNLLNPSVEEQKQRMGSRKKRGRKNKYYRQIDAEDGHEANQRSDESDESHKLDGIREEDDDDEEETRKKKENEAQRHEARRIEEEKAEQMRKKKAQDDYRKEMAKQQELKARQDREAVLKLQQEKTERRKREEAVRDAAIKKQKEEEKLKIMEEQVRRKQALADLEKKRKADEKARKELQEKKRKAEAQAKVSKEQKTGKTSNKDQSRGLSLRRGSRDSQDKGDSLSVVLRDDALRNFARQSELQLGIEVPPNHLTRRFNECDILGDVNRDSKGNVVVNADDLGKYKDIKGRITNQKGYLLDNSGNVINHQNGQVMFVKEDLDEKGEVPAPFALEKFGFNPHLIRGHFNFDQNGRPIMVPNQKKRKYFDTRGAEMSSKGYRIDDLGNIIDASKRMTFHRLQLTSDGNLPKLFTYTGRRFDILDCIGALDKNNQGIILFSIQNQNNGQPILNDLLGRRVNGNGYLIDMDDNVINKEGQILFYKRELLGDEIPKIFSFTRFNSESIMGELDKDPLGVPVIGKDANGNLIDKKGNMVNSKGYLIDKDGNIVDKRGKIVFLRQILDSNGDIPKVFRTGLLRSDSESSLSRLMSEIENQNIAEIPNQVHISPDKNRDINDPDYGMENIDDYGSQEEMDIFEDGLGALKAGSGLSRKRRKKRYRQKNSEYEGPTLRDHLLAGAYGGVAQPKPKRAGVKYTTDLDSGLRDIATPAILREASLPAGVSRRNIQPGITQSSLAGLEDAQSSARPHLKRNGTAGQPAGQTGPSDLGTLSGTVTGNQIMRNTDNLFLDSNAREASFAYQNIGQGQSTSKVQKQNEFEKILTKEIDTFLNETEWDAGSNGARRSRGSRKQSARSNSHVGRIRGLEKTYLPSTVEAKPIGRSGGGLSALQATGHQLAAKGSGPQLKGKLSSNSGGLIRIESQNMVKQLKGDDQDISDQKESKRSLRGASVQNLRQSKNWEHGSKAILKNQLHLSSVSSMNQKSSSVNRAIQK